MPEEVLYKAETAQTLDEIATTMRTVAEQLESGPVVLGDGADQTTVTIPADPTFEVELERLTDSETGTERYELEWEIRWQE